MLDPAIELGTSTPKADPSGDYAFALFGKAEAVKTGAKATLEAKALTLSGGPASVSPPTGRNLYAWVMETGKADIFLTYCTNALLAKADVPSLSIVAILKPLNVAADYGLVIMDGRRRLRMTSPRLSTPRLEGQPSSSTASVRETRPACGVASRSMRERVCGHSSIAVRSLSPPHRH